MTKIRPNELCPCGSGLKYKKCCMDTDSHHTNSTPGSSGISSSNSQFKIEKNGKIETIIEWVTKQSWGEWYIHAYLDYYSFGLKPDKNGQRAMEELHARSIIELAVFEGLVGSQTPLEMFIAQADLNTDQQNYYQNWVDRQVFSFFEVQEIELGQGLGVTDLIAQRDYYIQENLATYDLKSGMTLITRLAPHQDHWMITGGITAAFPPGFAQTFKKSLLKQNPDLPPERPTQFQLMESGFLSVELKKVVGSRPEGQILEDHYDLAAVKQAFALLGQELKMSKSLNEYLQSITGKVNFNQAEHKFQQVLIHCTSQKHVEKLLRLVKRWGQLNTNNQKNKPGPIECQFIEKASKYIGQHQSLDSKTKKRQTAAKKLTNQWLDKPQKKFEFKTAREVILEERKSLGNPEKRIAYSFHSFSSEMGGDGLSQHQSQVYNQATKQLQDGQALTALEKFTSLLPAAKKMRDVFRWYANVGSALAQLAQLDLAKKFFQQALQLNPGYSVAENNLKNLTNKKLSSKMLEQGLINLWSELHQVRWSLGLAQNEQLEGLLIDFDEKSGQIKTQLPAFLRDMQKFLDYIANKNVKLTTKRQDITLKQVKKLNQQLITPDPEENELLTGIKNVSAKYRLESEFPQVRLLHMISLAVKWVKVVVTKGKAERTHLEVTPKGKKWLRRSIAVQFDELLVAWWSGLNWAAVFNYANLATNFSEQKMAFYQDTLVIYLQRLKQAKGFVKFEELTSFSSFKTEQGILTSPILMERDIFIPLVRARLIEPQNKQLLRKQGGLKDWNKLEKKKHQQAYRLTPLGEVVCQALEQELQSLIPEAVVKMG